MSAPLAVADPAQDPAAERTQLVGFVRRQRELVRWKLEGLTDEQARAAATPSGLTVHGLVNHLAHVDRWWVRDRFAGQEGLLYDWSERDPDGELHVAPDARLADLLAAYAAEGERCDAVVAAAGLDDRCVHGDRSLRWVLLHLVEETSRHLGHLDLLVELAGGRLGDEPRA